MVQSTLCALQSLQCALTHSQKNQQFKLVINTC